MASSMVVITEMCEIYCHFGEIFITEVVKMSTRFGLMTRIVFPMQYGTKYTIQVFTTFI